MTPDKEEDDDERHRREETERRAKRKVSYQSFKILCCNIATLG
jgi:hypothetical protein